MDPGTALAVVSLTFQTFAGVVKAFELISEAGNMEYRLVEWARIVNVDRPDTQVIPGLNAGLAALLLTQLEGTLSSAEVLKQRYKLELIVAGPKTLDLERLQIQDTSENANTVVSKLISPQTRQDILGRSKKVKAASAFPKRMWWAAFDKQKFSLLVADCTSLVDSLYMLLDTANKSHASRIVSDALHDTLQSCEEIGDLEHLQAALQDEHNGIGLSTTLSASAGLKAAVLSLAERNSAERSSMPAELLDSTLITTTKKLTARISLGTHDVTPVVIEEKQVPHKMKGKLRSRVTELVSLLSSSENSTLATLPCVGYTEESLGYRLIFRLPPLAATAGQNTSVEPTTLLHMLSSTQTALPPVEHRLNLALHLSKTIFSFHSAGWLHKDIRSENIIFASPNQNQNQNLLNPLLCGFSFARRDQTGQISHELSEDPARDIYRHPDALGEVSEGYKRYMDCYGLGCLLIEIAEWAPLRKVVRKAVDVENAAGVRDDEFAALPRWLRKRYIEDEMAGFRLGKGFAELLALCMPVDCRDVCTLGQFLDALEVLSSYKLA
ncbi:hypothetical protein LTR62_002871 [Meristemomyces frigidus]|uniref:Protein kinase domain-containing protein n=1 Tax=Meristemomyces frigidus TaxID=1508187 RepID=A0AAN7YSL7_9PEZI|nr:hypothetical protein LTR62_002871 [Meristemomyces frigidus]